MSSTQVNVLAMAFGLISWVSADMSLGFTAIIGAGAGVGFNWDFIKENRREGIVIGIVSFLFPILVTQATLAIFKIETFEIGNLLGLLTGLVAFQSVRSIMYNQQNIVARTINLLFKRAGETNKVLPQDTTGGKD